ncbi:amiloride-sensitive sodium channel domain-containing protein [Ditylenchus destructor]|uniref:Amiloride-sensitive sodium channel domain-containing protein n=1 Tax=Ditylenchus destructor TaxID=166010 RepID=A0AAD4N1D9_9BILA|nr:amiloride-sensitive sodium channel domain-containing protein [Ditylenchus destructor]
MSNSSRNENGTESVFNSTLNGGSTFIDAATFREKSNTSWPSEISQNSDGLTPLCCIRSPQFGSVENSGSLIISECAENGREMPQKKPRIDQPADAPNNNAADESYTKYLFKRVVSFFSLSQSTTRKRNASSSAPANSSQNNDKVNEIKKTKWNCMEQEPEEGEANENAISRFAKRLSGQWSDEGSKRHCLYCRFLWRKEFHGLSALLKTKSATGQTLWLGLIGLYVVVSMWLSYFLLNLYVDADRERVVTLNTIKRRDFMLYPNLTICPKNVDALNFTAVESDIHFRLPHLNGTAINDLIEFTMAGAGFHNFDAHINFWSDFELEQLSKLFRKWRGNRPLLEFMKLIFETYGYVCHDLFEACFYGKRPFRCCEHFSPSYVMLRGRCFRLRQFFQHDPDETGKLSLYFRQMPSPFVSIEGKQPQVIVYVGDQYDDVPTWMLPPNPHCTTDYNNKGRGYCLVESWLRSRIIEPLNCTIFYMAHKHPEIPVCEPETVVRNYGLVDQADKLFAYNKKYTPMKYRCLPACKRDHIDIKLYFSEKRRPGMHNALFQLEASYENLQVEYYEERETTTLRGFISQIGGQMSLFLGISIVSVLQTLIPLSQAALEAVRKQMAKSDIISSIKKRVFSRMPATMYSGILREVFSFHTRRDMLKLSPTCRSFNIVIENDLADSAPYIVMSCLWYTKYAQTFYDSAGVYEWRWDVSCGGALLSKMPKEVIATLPSAKFVRFQNVNISLHSVANPLDLLESVKHVWKGYSLTVFGESDMPWLELAGLISVASPAQLYLNGNGSFAAVEKLLRLKNGPEWIDIKDETKGQAMHNIPIVNIVGFLFKPLSIKACRWLKIWSSEALNDDKGNEIIDAIEKKFLNSKKPVAFMCSWMTVISLTSLLSRSWNSRDVTNAQSGQLLNIKTSEAGSEFYMRTKHNNNRRLI